MEVFCEVNLLNYKIIGPVYILIFSLDAKKV